MKPTSIASLASLVAAAALAACHAPPPEPPVGGGVAPAERAALDQAWPAIAHACAPCHSRAGHYADAKAMQHLDMSTYPFGGHHAATAGFEVREALGLTGKPATMPKDEPGSVRGADLDAIDGWAKAWIAAHPDARPDEDDGDHHESPLEHGHGPVVLGGGAGAGSGSAADGHAGSGAVP